MRFQDSKWDSKIPSEIPRFQWDSKGFVQDLSWWRTPCLKQKKFLRHVRMNKLESPGVWKSVIRTTAYNGLFVDYL